MVEFHSTLGDAEECERFLMIDALAPLMEAERIKVYSVDSLGTQALLDSDLTREQAARTQNLFEPAFIRVSRFDQPAQVQEPLARIRKRDQALALWSERRIQRTGIQLGRSGR